MFWNKKEDRSSLPDLPPLKTGFAEPSESISIEESDDVEDIDSERHNLPSFPDSPIKKGFSQSAIKDAVTTREIEEKGDEEEKDNFSPMLPQGFKPEPRSFTPRSITYPPEEKEGYSSKKQNRNDIFVKIDKFHTARRSLNMAQEKVEEIEHLLKKIRETRMREEQELTTWEKDITSAKEKIEDVSKNLFDKLA